MTTSYSMAIMNVCWAYPVHSCFQ